MSANLYLDDSPKVVAGLRLAGRAVVVYDHSYNRHLPGWRIPSWDIDAPQRFRHIAGCHTAFGAHPAMGDFPGQERSLPKKA